MIKVPYMSSATDNPNAHRHSSYGRIPGDRVRGAGARALEHGWLPPGAAAKVMNISMNELWRAVRARALHTVRVGPGALLVEVVHQ